jgi:trk system potassium uptake protein TrkA
MGVRIAQNLISSNVLDYIEFAPEYGVIEILASDNMVGRTLKELELRASFDVNVMAIKRGDQLYISPGAEDKIEVGDKLVLMGKNENLDKMRDFGN